MITRLERLSRYHLPVLLGLAGAVWLQACLRADALVIGWRPTDSATIALNYLRNGFRFLYPQINWGGAGPGFVETEFPLIPFATAVLYRIFGVHDALALVIPLASGFGLVACTYLLVRRIHSRAAAFFAGVFTALSPAVAVSATGMYHDLLMVFLCTAGIYYLLRWVQEDRSRDCLLSASAVALAVLEKPTAMLVGVPLLYLFLLKYGWSFWRAPAFWFFGAATLLPAGLWYYHAHTLYVSYGNTFGILGAGYSKFATWALLSDPAFYLGTVQHVVKFQLTPLVFLIFLYGLRTPIGMVPGYLLHIWCGAVLFYVLVTATGASIGPDWYLLPIIPPGAALAGVGTAALLSRLESSGTLARVPAGRMALSAVVASLIVSSMPYFHYSHAKGNFYNRQSQSFRRTGLAVRAVTEPGSLIIVVDYLMDARVPENTMNTPDVFYFGDRRGWYFATAWLRKGLIEQTIAKGARYLVITGFSLERFHALDPSLRRYLASFETVMDNEDGIVYDLSRRVSRRAPVAPGAGVCRGGCSMTAGQSGLA